MIMASGSRIIVEGSMLEVTAEMTALLRIVYKTLSEEISEEYANGKLVEIGRLAVMSEEELRGGK